MNPDSSLKRRVRSLRSLLPGILAILIALCAYFLVAFNHHPNFLRAVSLVSRTGFTLVIPAAFTCFYVAFRLTGWTGRLFSLGLILAAFALPLAGGWAGGVTEAGILSGVVPMFDSTSYYLDAHRLLAGWEFTTTSSRRPVFSAFFAALLALVRHDLMLALALVNLLVAVSAFLFAREIRSTHGPAVAAFALVPVFMFYRYHSGAVRTEALGMALALQGIALLWRGAARPDRNLALAGVFLTAVALIVRAGAFFVLPALLLWGGWRFRPAGKAFSWSFVFSGGLLVLLAFGINQLAVGVFGTRSAVPFGNFSYSLYGLVAGGKGWAYIFQVYPSLPADQDVYRLAFEQLRSNPWLLLEGAGYYWRMYLSNTGYGVFSYMTGDGAILAAATYWGLCALSLAGLFAWMRKKNDPLLSLVACFAIGVFLSVPFLPPIDTSRLRAYAASIPSIALLPAMGADFLLGLGRSEAQRDGALIPGKGGALAWLSLLTVTLVLAVPFALRGSEGSPPLPAISSCSAGDASIIVRYDPGTVIQLLPQNRAVLEWPPEYKIGSFRRNLHDFPNFTFAGWAAEIKPGTSLFQALDIRSRGNALVVLPTGSLPDPPAWIEACGDWVDAPADLRGFHIFAARSVASLER